MAQQPNWQPLSMLPTIANHIREGLESTQQQYHNLLRAREKPHVLDDYTFNRVIQVYTTQQDDLWLYEEQLARWKKLTPPQAQQLATLAQQLERLRAVTEKILNLADELKAGTIDSILRKSDVELALEVLSGKRKLP